jgi:hypothetical protein
MSVAVVLGRVKVPPVPVPWPRNRLTPDDRPESHPWIVSRLTPHVSRLTP